MKHAITWWTVLAAISAYPLNTAYAASTGIPLARGLEQIGRAIQGPVVFWAAVISLITSFYVIFLRGNELDSFGGKAAMAGLVFGGIGAGAPALLELMGLSSAVLP
jgi:type IV secretory pathway VirB2 component (pilin)